MNPKHEKIIIPKGRKQLFRKVLTKLKKKDSQFKALMDKMPDIQTLPSHSYCYVPFDYAIRIKEMYEELHYEKYGFVD